MYIIEGYCIEQLPQKLQLLRKGLNRGQEVYGLTPNKDKKVYR